MSNPAESQRGPRTTLGAYALTPGPDAHEGKAEREFYTGLATLDIDVLEFPYLPDNTNFSSEWIAQFLKPEWDLLVTCIPFTMTQLGQRPEYGLASNDHDARQAALADLAVVRDLAQRLAEESGRPRVSAIAVHSAPGPAAGSEQALAESLAEMLTWDLAGAEIVLEHCDALVAEQPAEKGFLTIEEEISAIQAALAADDGHSSTRLGLGINWGRSAIEGRSATTPATHIRTAAEAGLLRSIIFSGAAGTQTSWGPAWSDSHIPARGDDPALNASSPSLLGLAQIQAALHAAGDADLGYVGAKVTAQPAGAGLRSRLALARASLEQIASVTAAR